MVRALAGDSTITRFRRRPPAAGASPFADAFLRAAVFFFAAGAFAVAVAVSFVAGAGAAAAFAAGTAFFRAAGRGFASAAVSTVSAASAAFTAFVLDRTALNAPPPSEPGRT